MANDNFRNKLSKYLNKDKGKITILSISAIASITLKVIAVFIFGDTINSFVQFADEYGLLKNFIIIILLWLISIGLHWYSEYNAIAISNNVIDKVKCDTYRYLQLLSIENFKKMNIIDVTNVFTKDYLRINKFLSFSLLDLLTSSFAVLSSIILSLFIDFRITITIILGICITFALFYALRKVNKDKILNHRKANNNLDTYINDTLLNLKIIKSRYEEKEHILKFHDLNNSLYVTRTAVDFMNESLFSFIRYIIFAIILISIYILGMSLSLYFLNVGYIINVILLATLLFRPINNVIQVFKEYPNVVKAIENIDFIYSIKDTIKNSDDAKTIEALSGAINFENVSYSIKNKKLISDINLEIKSGEKIALLEKEPLGIYALINILERFYLNNGGKIKVDGNYISDIKIDSFRNRLGYIEHETRLFSGTIKDNILVGKTTATDEEVMLAAKFANLHDFIMTLKDNYDTEITPETTMFTKAQKKLIGFARVFLKNPDIIIIEEDKPTSIIQDELSVQNAIDNITKNKTSLIVANTKKTVKTASRVIVFDNGKIVEDGNHEGLIGKVGPYTKIYNSL